MADDREASESGLIESTAEGEHIEHSTADSVNIENGDDDNAGVENVSEAITTATNGHEGNLVSSGTENVDSEIADIENATVEAVDVECSEEIMNNDDNLREKGIEEESQDLVHVSEADGENAGVENQDAVHVSEADGENADVENSVLESTDMDNVLQSEIFREELQEMVVEQLANSILSAQLPLMDLLSLKQRFGRMDQSLKQDNWTIIPVADIRGVDTLNYGKSEKQFRNRLASCYRLMDLFGWTDGMNSGTVTARIDEETESSYLLVAPYGLIYDEVTSSSLAKASVSGTDVIDAGSSGLLIDTQSLEVHRALYNQSNRTDIKCIMQLNSVSAVTMSSMKSGLLPLCPEAMMLGDISYSDFTDDVSEVTGALGPTSKILVIRNHGIVICGSSIEEAFHLAFNTMAAVDVQMTIAAFGLNNIRLPSDEVCRNVYDNSRRPPVGATSSKRRWKRGELEFESMMRQLDSVGCQTGHIYSDVTTSSSGLVKIDRSVSDAELTPFAATIASFGGSNSELSRAGGSPLKVPRRAATPDWRASPNMYLKEQVLEKTVDRQEKKITKWVPVDTSQPQKSTTRTDKPNQFAPQGINPAELKEKVKAIRRDYYTDRVTAGPQSRILEGINWAEAAQASKDNAAGSLSSAESAAVSVKAVSKGIIQREHQSTATVLCQNLFDPPNPFNRMSEDDIEQYKSVVESQTKSGVGNEAEPVEVEGVQH